MPEQITYPAGDPLPTVETATLSAPPILLSVDVPPPMIEGEPIEVAA